MTTDIFTVRYDLLQKKQLLADMCNVNDMQWYGSAWLQLADEFREIGYTSNEEYCRERGMHYLTLAEMVPA